MSPEHSMARYAGWEFDENTMIGERRSSNGIVMVEISNKNVYVKYMKVIF